MFDKTRERIAAPIRQAVSLAWTAIVLAVFAILMVVARAR